jgi:hypothetical protein
MNLDVYKPVAFNSKLPKPFAYAHRASTLKGKHIGLIDTSKVNADLFLKRIEELLLKYGIADTIHIKKLTPGLGLNPEQLAEIKNKVDAALIAFGD